MDIGDNTDTALETWLSHYSVKDIPWPSIRGKYAGRNLIICADAACVWDDLERFGARVDHRRGEVGKSGWDIMTINKIVEFLPGNILHAYSNQPEILNKFIAARRWEYTRGEFNGPEYTHSINKGAQFRWPWSGHGTSLLGGVFCGLMMGYEQNVICGGPLDDGPHNGEPHWRKTTFSREATDFRPGEMNHHWRRMKQYAGDRVKSMSGRTKQWLGAPPC